LDIPCWILDIDLAPSHAQTLPPSRGRF